MGIQLDDFDARWLFRIAELREQGDSIYPFLYGALASCVDLFVAGKNKQSDLESLYASLKLLERLCQRHSVEELREIASGTREVPGEDV